MLCSSTGSSVLTETALSCIQRCVSQNLSQMINSSGITNFLKLITRPLFRTGWCVEEPSACNPSFRPGPGVALPGCRTHKGTAGGSV